MSIYKCQEADLIEDFKRECPTLWQMIELIMTPEHTRWQGKEFNPKEVGQHAAYFVINHILKLRGGTTLSARAAMVGVFLENQGM